jgi:AcrR family transcriptional regulator
MTAIRTEDPPRPGLRERKKARTRALIQEHALRLFREQGYEETSVEQIAEAAEVSPSTIFRYFPTKPDLVIYDDMDYRLISAFQAQPPELNALQAMRGAFLLGFGDIADDQAALIAEREKLLRTVPELRSAMLDELARTVQEIATLIGERAGRPASDDEVLALAGAIIGIIIAAWFADDADGFSARLARRVEVGLALLESGFML